MMDAKKIWNQYESALRYKQTNNLNEIASTNERFYNGDQWHGVTAKGMPKPTFNFLEQIVNLKVSMIMSKNIKIMRKPDELSVNMPRVQTAAKAFTKTDAINWSRLRMKKMNEELLLDAALSGLGVSHWFWDDEIVQGNKHKTKGDIDGELIDMVNFFVSNPNERSVQKQDWIILSSRKSVKKIREIAKANGVSEEKIASIKPDERSMDEGFDKAVDEQDNVESDEQSATMLVKYWKKDDRVFFQKTVGEVDLTGEVDTKLNLYPVAIMPWSLRKKFIYGGGEITYLIENQKHVNKMEAARQLHTLLMSIPKVLYNKLKIAGITNQVGGIIGVNGDTTGTLEYVQPANMATDVDKSINDALSLSRELKGVNDNLLGVSRPENAVALQQQQKASGVPMESVERRFDTYLEDVAAIWMAFYTSFYNTERMIIDDNLETVPFVGTDLTDVNLLTKIDIGASTHFTEAASMEKLDALLADGHIDIVQYLERYPDGIIPDKERLIEDLGGAGGLNREFKFEMMARTLETMDDQTRAQMLNLPEEDRESAIMRYALERQALPEQVSAQPQAQSQAAAKASAVPTSTKGVL